MDYSRDDRNRMIGNMQKNLRLIRQASGWSAQELADMIGVSRQTINNIETGKNPMNATQYVAICAMLDIRIKEKPGLENVVEAVLNMNDDDEPDDLSSEIPDQVIPVIDESIAKASAATTIGAATAIGTAAAIGSVAIGGAIGSLAGPVGAVAGSLVGNWLLKTTKK